MSLFGKSNYTFIKVKRKEIPIGVWTKCPGCESPAYSKELKNNLNVCPKCRFHLSLTARDRVEHLIDEGSFVEHDANLFSSDPLKFQGAKAYKDKLKEDQEATDLDDAVITGHGCIEGHQVGFAVTDSRFIMGSMGSVVGERITRIIEYATKEKCPVIIISGSGGGARMYEGAISLMQMAKTCAALERHAQADQLYISVLTNPTMGGIMASFAGVGDIIIAEPKALIGFAGPRVVEQTIRQKLPPGFQRSEFMLAHGMIDMIVERQDLKGVLAHTIAYAQE
ncbi:MAG: acetyl-CoA carboxylase carboxyltransferase subunit beta [Candidatus Omnitrophica bacterium]|nr:acetyl-CoA carboxylase carboxyltransferase subunit beta [Candidatus Omnitrophota bacterium]